MANRTVERINLPSAERRSLVVQDIPQVDIPKMSGGANRLLAMGAITQNMAQTVAAIDDKNQKVAAEKEFNNIFLEAQKEIKDFHATATGDEDITDGTLSIYEKYINGLEGRGLPSRQVELIRSGLQARTASIGQAALDYELKLKAQKYDENLSETINSAANIIASEPRVFKTELSRVGQIINESKLNGAEKAARLNKAEQMLGGVYLSRLAELNPAKARAELNSKEFNNIIDPNFKTRLLGKLDADAKARASLALQDDIKNIDQARKLGIAVPREFIEKTARNARVAGQEKAAVNLDKYAVLQDWGVEFSQKPLNDQQQQIKDLQAEAKTGNLAELDKLELAIQSYSDKVTGIKGDAWGYYSSKGIIEEPAESLLDAPLESQSLIINQRRIAQEKINQLEGGQVALPLLTRQETAQLSAMKETAEPKEFAALLTRIGAGMNGDERRTTVAAVSQKEPLLAVAMSQDYDTAQRLIAGSRAKGEVTPAKVREKVADKIKGLTIDGVVNDTLHDSVYAYYKQMAFEKGDVSKEPQDALIQQAITDVVGNIEDINTGKPSRVIIPRDMDGWEVEDRLNSLTDEQLIEQQGELPVTADGSRATAEDLKQFGQFMSAGDGLYAVRFKSGTLYQNNGEPYVIDVRRLKTILPQPDAFLETLEAAERMGR